MGDITQYLWQWLQSQWVQSDFASWLAVVLAVMAVCFALRKSRQHTEISNPRLQFNLDGGPISLELELATYSHAPRLTAEARLKIGGNDYPMRLELPIKAPTNYQFAVLNTFKHRFVGQYVKSKIDPETAFIAVTARLSDGSRASLRRHIVLHSDENPSEPKIEKGGSQT